MSSSSRNTRAVPVLTGVALLSALLLVGFMAHPQGYRCEHYFRSVLMTGCGVGFGMIAASFASPVKDAEGAIFKIIVGAIVTFSTGFLLKQYAFELESLPLKLEDALFSTRFWMVLAAALGGGIATYVFRAYYGAGPSDERVKKANEALQAAIKLISDLNASKK